MPGGRPPGPLRRYSVEFVWPTDPSRYREAVIDEDEETARTSAGVLLSMNFAFQVRMRFLSASGDRTCLGHCTAAQWDRLGHVTYVDQGEFAQYIPGWVTGREPLVKEKRNEPAPVGS